MKKLILLILLCLIPLNSYGVNDGTDEIFPSGNVGIGTTSPLAKFEVANGTTSAGVIAIREDADDGTNNATFTVPALAADTDYILPADDGDAGEQLQTNGSGTLTWEAAGGGSGDITSVGDVADGAAFDGTQGTTLTFNNAGGDKTLSYDGTDFDFNASLDVSGYVSMNSIDSDTLIVAAGSTYTTIQGALNAANAGDTIWVEEGTYTETITFGDDNVTLRAMGGAEATIITQAAANVVVFGTYEGCIIDGFTISITNANSDEDYCISGANDTANNTPNIIQDCKISIATSNANHIHALGLTDGNYIFSHCRFIINNTNTGAYYSSLIESSALNDLRLNDCDIDIDMASTTTTTSYVIYIVTASHYFSMINCRVRIDSPHTTTGTMFLFYLSGAGATDYFFGNEMIATASSTGALNLFYIVNGTTYLLGNTLSATTSDADAQWMNIAAGGTIYATGNTVTGNCIYTNAGTAYMVANSINTDLINGGGDKLANATEVGAMFWDGIVIGTDNDNNILDDATHGGGVGTLYLGNATVDATFTGFHYYKLGDKDLKAGELVCLKDGLLYRSIKAKDPTVIGIYCGLTNWKDSFGNTLIDGKLIDKEYDEWDEVTKTHIKKIKKEKDFGQSVNVITQEPSKPDDYSYSVAIVGDSIHENTNAPLTGAYVTVKAGIIKSGDYLCSSDKKGYLEKQPDNLMYNYTVAKAREDISKDTQKGYIYLLQ